MASAPSWLRDFSGAWIFYSVLPPWPFPQPRFERIARFAPWIGLVIGGLQAGLWLLLSGLGWPHIAIISTVLAFGIWLTGGLHLDGLMDMADGLAAGPDRCLEAMEDSRVGASGVQLLVLVLLLQFGALMRLGPEAPMAWVVAIALARVSPLWAMARFPYLRVNGTAGFHRRYAKGFADTVPTLILLLLLLAMAHTQLLPLLSVPIFLLTGLLVAECLGRRLGGMTGDGYGAVVILSETFSLLALAFLAPLLGSAGG